MHYFRHSYARSASSVFVILRPSRPRPTTEVHLASATRATAVLELPRVQASVVIRDDVSILRGAGSPGVARHAGVPGHRIPGRWQRRQSRGGERGVQAERRRGRRLRGERFVARDRSAARIRPAVPDEGEDRRLLPIAIIGASTRRTRVGASTRSGIDPAFGRGGSGHDRRIGERRIREISQGRYAFQRRGDIGRWRIDDARTGTIDIGDRAGVDDEVVVGERRRTDHARQGPLASHANRRTSDRRDDDGRRRIVGRRRRRLPRRDRRKGEGGGAPPRTSAHGDRQP